MQCLLLDDTAAGRFTTPGKCYASVTYPHGAIYSPRRACAAAKGEIPQMGRDFDTTDSAMGWLDQALRIAIVAGGLLVFSLACYTCHRTGWNVPGPEGFNVNADRAAMGLPLHWLTFTKWRIQRGKRPAFWNLPEGREYAPGFRIRPLRLLLAIVTAGAAAGMVWLCGPRVLRRRHVWAGPVGGRRYAGICLLAVACAGLASAPTWLGLAAVFAFLPAGTLALTWPGGRFGPAVLGAAAASASLWWGLRLWDHFRWQRTFTEMGWAMDLAAPAAYFLVCAALLAGVVGVRRLVARRKG